MFVDVQALEEHFFVIWEQRHSFLSDFLFFTVGLNYSYKMDQAFKNMQPRTRNQRIEAIDNELMQKERIAQRTGGHHRFENPGHVIVPQPGSIAHQPEEHRFHKDFASEDAGTRAAERERKANRNEFRRQEMVNRDQHRWGMMDAESQNEANRLNNISSKWQQGQKNYNSQAYNPITLEYDPTEQGRNLQAADQKKRQWENARMDRIDSHQNPGYNILNGETRQQFKRF